MAKDDTPKNWSAFGALILLKLADTGLLPAAFLCATMGAWWWVLTRNLNSPDTLKLLESLTGSRFFAWAGWIVAACVVPISVWAVRSARHNRETEIERLRAALVEKNGQTKKQLAGIPGNNERRTK